MKLLLSLSLVWLQAAWAIEPQSQIKYHQPEYPAVTRVYFTTKQQLQELDTFSDVWSVNQQQNFATIYIEDPNTLEKIKQMGLVIHHDHKLQSQFIKNQQAVAQKKNLNGSGIPGFACYSTVEETFLRMDQMAFSYPDLVEIVDIGDSWEKTTNGNTGHDINILKITNKNIKGDKPILFLASAIHAREYATAELNTRFAEYLVSEYGDNADVTWILDHHEIHFSLQTNPDGRKQAETGVLWRKNTNDDYCSQNSDFRGADLNRNYSFEWGGENDECSNTYGGSSAESEPELTAQMAYIRQIFDDNRGPGLNDPVAEDTAGIFVDIHSYSQLVLYPWGFMDSDSPNENQFSALSKRTAWFNNYLPEPASDLYPVNGASIDTTYGELGIASLVFELGTAFFQDCATFNSTVFPDNLAALLYLARVTQAPYKQPLGPDIENLNIVPNVITADTDVMISGTANDNLYSQANGPQITENIQAITVYRNELPIKASSGTPIMPIDGVFDQKQESFNSRISTAGLKPGKNIIFIQANDGTRAGATFAEFVDVINTDQVAQLSGQVTDAYSGQAIPGSLLNINQSNALTTIDGSFTQWVQPGLADLTVVAANYQTQTIANLDLLAGQPFIQNIQLNPFCEVFSDDVENGNQGWTIQSPWAISTELSSSPDNAWSDSPGGNYNNNRNYSITSPDISVTDAETIEISYMSHCDTEAGYDYGHLEIQFDGASWQEISRCDNQANWRQEQESINLPNEASVMKIRFRLSTDGGVTRDGWHLDDIKVKASGSICANQFDDSIFINGFE